MPCPATDAALSRTLICPPFEKIIIKVRLLEVSRERSRCKQGAIASPEISRLSKAVIGARDPRAGGNNAICDQIGDKIAKITK